MIVVLTNVLVDGSDEFWNASEGTATDTLVGQFSKPTLHQIEPGRTGRCEMEMESRMSFQPAFDAGVLMRPVIVDDDMYLLVGRDPKLNQAQEFQEFLVAVLGHALSDDFAIEHVQRRE